MRLAKYLAHAGVASRRASEDLIAAGRVRVGGELAKDPARDVDESSGVEVDGKPVVAERREVYVVNKPAGVVSTASDTHDRPIVTDMVETDLRLYPVGRLDADTTGLILLTNDGELADQLTHPRYEVPKTYIARVRPPLLSARGLRTLREGVELDDGKTAPAKARQVKPGMIEVTIHEGRKHQVRRMVAAVGHEVDSLERVAFGPLRLAGLPPGATRRLSAAEVERLKQAAWKNQPS